MDADRCGCETRVDHHRLVVDATDCPAGGRLTNPACRARVVGAVTPRVTSIRVRIEAGTVVYPDGIVGLLVAAARFAALVEADDADLARRARRDLRGAARAAVGRRGRVADLAAETGLIEGVRGVASSRNGFDAAAELNPLTSAGGSRPMLHDIDDAGELDSTELRARYDERLRAVIDERGVETVADESGVEAVRALAAGDSPEITLDEAAAVLATSEDEPEAEAIVAETRDALLLGMTTAVLDVEAVESGIDGSFDAREIQQKIEGRLPMTLDELAMIHGYIEERKP
ncbi:hypothetical protein C447_13909 [Halococcus hamelinensis 100A6]|uniref:Uncharacterized protein n=3 Tax=Halococcus hamelinensis TaxID=332168 RepID=M0LT16_9EURY|nr:hypothetical protein C447_13909 [Halococcus hamelinensis 100A6]